MNDSARRRASKTSNPCPRKAHGKTCAELFAHYENQFNDYSCSVASVAMILNAIRAKDKSNPAPITQKEILDAVRVIHWSERVSETGFSGSHGLSLKELEIAIEASFKRFGIHVEDITAVAIHEDLPDLNHRHEQLLSLFKESAREQNRYFISHFTQGVLVGDWFGGHISPVGAFEENSNQVLIMDVDEDSGGPYWISYERFFEAMIGKKKIYGPKGGGYICIRVPKNR